MKTFLLTCALMGLGLIQARAALVPPPGTAAPTPRTQPALPPRSDGAIGGDPVAAMEAQIGMRITQHLGEIVRTSPQQWRSHRTPWVDRRWMLDRGLVGDRYLDQTFSSLKTFSDRFSYVFDHSAWDLAAQVSRNGGSIDRQLSPVEKYDLLVGDRQGTLTQKIWTYAKSFADSGSITSWSALCDGAAAASMAVPEPRRDVVLNSPEGVPIEFHPYDIKGLATLFYSGISIKNIPIIGGRCRGGNSRECYEPRPDTFHRIVTQVAGRYNWPVMMDHSPGEAVWNSPIAGYIIRYFNPATRRFAATLPEAAVDLGRWPGDPFAGRRASGAIAAIGVVMITQLTPPASQGVGARTPELRQVSYQYELEVDAAGALVGGQWETKLRPDFLWTIDLNHWPRSIAERRLHPDQWTDGSVPAEWLPVIQESSAAGQPVVRVLQHLLELAR